MVERLDHYVERKWPDVPMDEIDVRESYVSGKMRWSIIRRLHPEKDWLFERLGLLKDGSEPVRVGDDVYILPSNAPTKRFRLESASGQPLRIGEFHPIQVRSFNERRSREDRKLGIPGPRWHAHPKVA